MASKKTTEDDLHGIEERKYNISFKKRRTKSSIRLGAKIFTSLIIAALSGVIFSKALIDIKYGAAIKSIESFVNDNMIINDYSKIIDTVSPSIVTVGSSEENFSDYRDSNETGIILDKSGNILTTYSLIKDYKNIFVKLSSADSKVLQAKIIVKNEDIDLAIIKVNSEEELEPVKFANDDDVIIGQEIAVIGNTTGSESADMISPGIITSIGEEVNLIEKKYDLLEVSAPINKRNAGGPICNSKGEVIGLASYSLSESNKGSGFYYGIQIKDLKVLINSTNAFKSVLGVNEGGILTDETSEFKGFYVQDLDKSGNAYKAGIKPTDIILEIDDAPIISIEEATIILQGKKQGESLDCKVLRDGMIEEIEVKIN